MTGRRKAIVYGFVVFLGLLAIRGAGYWQPMSHILRTDDFGPLAYPAYLAGYDWSSYLSGWDYYYGYGYYWIFFPLFRIVRDPHVLLACIIGINVLLMSLTGVLIYQMMTKYLHVEHGLLAVVCSIVPALIQGEVKTNSTIWYHTDNEVPLFFACWILVWLILKASRLAMDEEKGWKIIRVSVLSAVLLCWMLTVHERAQALLLSVVFVELFLYFLKKKWLFHPAAFFIPLVFGFLGQRMLRRNVISVLWAGNPPGRNLNVLSRMDIPLLLSRSGIKAMAVVLLGNLHSFLICGFGLPVLAAILVLLWVYHAFRSGKRKIKGRKREDRAEAWIDPAMLIMLVFGICACIVIAGLVARWGSMLAPGIASGEIVYEYKGICYNRYYYVLTGPILFGLFGYLIRKKTIGKEITGAWWCIFGMIEIPFFCAVFPLLVRADILSGSTYVKRASGIVGLNGAGNWVSIDISVFWMLAAMLLLTWVLLLGQRKVQKQMLLYGCFLLLIFAADRGSHISSSGPSLTFKSIETTSALLSKLEEQGILPDHVYMSREKSGYGLQYMNRTIRFCGGRPSQSKWDEDNMIVLPNSLDTEMEKYIEAGYARIPIDELFTLYTNNAKVISALAEDGYTASTAVNQTDPASAGQADQTWDDSADPNADDYLDLAA